ncbi:MAG: histidine phosphatase family protein [Rhodospirillum sp.]|nr:histidine phosphatase family protein [Rhodospirillum sp.]MCF8490717.1 histidine phosphatase family protein [Rhodospirillum sp.]MCF8499384.1 histidine phosphatase family protein [Rhodospirillum sp.]
MPFTCPSSHPAPLFRGPFLFLRHGESTTNRAGIIAGWRDPELTELGREQALQAMAVLAHHPVTSIFSSPLRRAWDTAAPTSRVLGLPVEAVEGLKERNWGDLEGRPLSERPHMYMIPEGGESWEAFGVRIWAALESLDPVPGMPLIVAHSGVMRVIRARLGLSEGAERVANAQPIRLDPPGPGEMAWRETPLDHSL